MLDPDHHGKVTKIEFQVNKMNAFYFRFRPRKNASSDMKPLTFEEMRVSREFFDKADQGHEGHLDAVDINDAIHFEDIETTTRLFRFRRSSGLFEEDRSITDIGSQCRSHAATTASRLRRRFSLSSPQRPPGAASPRVRRAPMGPARADRAPPRAWRRSRP